MKHLLPLLTLSLAPLTTAHFTLDYPPSRGTNAEDSVTFPCGAFSTPSSNRTQISLSDPFFPIQLDMGHDQTAVEFLLAIGNNPGDNYNVTLRHTFRVEGLGGFCVPSIELTEELLGVELVDGLNVTLQVQTNSHPSGGLYSCADLTLTTATVDPPADSVCSNNTGITASAFSGAAAERHANESTPEGQSQSGSDDHSDHSSGDNSTTGNETSSADSPEETDGAAALRASAIGWVSLAAVVVGGLFAL
ncbi:hypothetical protein BJY01DRAFT_235087 [Aspergillus pseudoustus]|uniref:Copper acquisition factor BIM1-like domain-containing protein n=1 Tax=Aspergillus pseudoustus TaxID=1810923 RepID=A0ABR4JY58_9EURO